MPIRSDVLLLAAVLLVVAAAVIVRLALTVRGHAELLRTRELALTDELTGLPNRRLFAERLHAALADEEEGSLAYFTSDGGQASTGNPFLYGARVLDDLARVIGEERAHRLAVAAPAMVVGWLDGARP